MAFECTFGPISVVKPLILAGLVRPAPGDGISYVGTALSLFHKTVSSAMLPAKDKVTHVRWLQWDHSCREHLCGHRVTCYATKKGRNFNLDPGGVRGAFDPFLAKYLHWGFIINWLRDQ